MTQHVGRLAMRVEGDWWVAYSASIGTMEGALELGRVRMSICQNKKIKDATLEHFKMAFAEVFKDATGIKLLWPNGTQSAPEHEKAGRA